jgi:hypothetical protein
MTAVVFGAYGHANAFQDYIESSTASEVACMTVNAVLHFPRRRLCLMVAMIAAVYELPSVLYILCGVIPYNGRWCNPSRLGWVRGAVHALAGVGAPGVRAWLLFGTDVAATVSYLAVMYLLIPIAVALCVRRMYLSNLFPMRAGKMRVKGKSA